MKKLYTTQEWICRSKIRAKNALKKRRSSRYIICYTKKNAYQLETHAERRDEKLCIQSPEHLSIINNTIETLDFFELIHARIKRGESSLFLDLSNIKKITTDSILYLLSALNKYRFSGVSILGNLPNDASCRDVFIGSGFHKFVQHGTLSGPRDASVFSIKHGLKVEPVMSKDIISFAKQAVPEYTTNTKCHTRIILECMANTNNHAYRNVTEIKKWWIIAQSDKPNNSVNFTFLDNGMGIPQTIRRDFKESIRELAAMTGIVDTTRNSALILSALEGKFRTRTGLRERGLGLPAIYKMMESSEIKDLFILSSKGLLDFRQVPPRIKELPLPFRGTLYSWKFY